MCRVDKIQYLNCSGVNTPIPKIQKIQIAHTESMALALLYWNINEH